MRWTCLIVASACGDCTSPAPDGTIGGRRTEHEARQKRFRGLARERQAVVVLVGHDGRPRDRPHDARRWPTGPKPRWLSSRCMARMVSAPASSGRTSGVSLALDRVGLEQRGAFRPLAVREPRRAAAASARAGVWAAAASPASLADAALALHVKGVVAPPLPPTGRRCPSAMRACRGVMLSSVTLTRASTIGPLLETLS